MIALFVIAGVIAGAIFSLLPALHIYNIVAIILLMKFPPLCVASFCLGLIVGFSVVNTIPSVFLGAPDESAVFLVLPGQKYLLLGRGYEACVLSGIGSILAIFSLILLIPLFQKFLPFLKILLARHYYWLLGSIICYILMSEWPKGGDRGTPFYRFLDGWRTLSYGLLTFFLSGLLGIILFYKPLIPVERGFQNLMPVFVGLFAIPWVLMNIISGTKVPEQNISSSVNVRPVHIFHGWFAGAIGGLLAAFLPAITGGVGGLLAGHATAQRDDRVFIISQGASKVFYYVGGYLFYLIPGVNLKRGGLAWMVGTVYSPASYKEFWQMMIGLCIGGLLAFFLLIYFAKIFARYIYHFSYKMISIIALCIIILLVVLLTGIKGLLIAATATGIGLIPVLYGSRRMNCLGVILLPITLNMAGLGDDIAKFLGF